MDLSSLHLRRHEEEAIECWDDDEDLQCGEDLYFRTASTATSVTGSSARPSGHRDSISSRRSWRSDRDSNIGDEESWQLLLNENDDFGAEDAIASAKNAGIPLPVGIPKSALLGGTIKRLGGRKAKRTFGDDWSDDLDLSKFDGQPELKLGHLASSPDSLLHLISLPTSPSKNGSIDIFTDVIHRSPPPKIVSKDLDKFRDTENDDDDSFLDAPAMKPALFLPPQTAPQTALNGHTDDFEDDLVLPSSTEPLRLSTRREHPNTPDLFTDAFDTEWAEGSIGAHFGAAKRDGFSNRSSTVSAFSPSLSSCLTAESEDDGLDGIILPDGPLDLGKSLQNKQKSLRPSTPEHPPEADAVKKAKDNDRADEDFFSGIEIGNGEVFDTEKLTLNRNIKRKLEKPASPARRRSTTLTFTSKPTNTRIPRLSGHEKTHSTQLEPVSESGAPVSNFTRSHSRLSGHATHSSLSSIPLPSTPSIPSTLSAQSRRPVGNRSSKDSLRSDPTTTAAQLLKAKRSAPVMRTHTPGIVSALQRSPPPRQDLNSRGTISTRPKTPVDRSPAESRFGLQRRGQVPFLPAGASPNQSHNVNVKTTRSFQRHNSDSSGDIFSHQRSTSTKSSSSYRSDTPGRSSGEFTTESFAASVKRTVTKPTKKRQFGDGTELDIFDDLPTSTSNENKFTRTPAKRGAHHRSRFSQSSIPEPPRMVTPPGPTIPMSPTRPDYTPRFARDTNASRSAREQRVASLTQTQKDRENAPLSQVNANPRTHSSGRQLSSPTMMRSKPRHRHRDSVSRPHLIKPMGSGVNEAKSVKGMQYNPGLYKWEGNENATASFDPPAASTPSKPPALISNFGGGGSAQVVGSMVFDPQRMCWLSVTSPQPGKVGVPTASDEDDVFAGFEDLEDRPQKPAPTPRAVSSGSTGDVGDPMTPDDKSGESSDDWPITEEFDVGPEFVRRQRVEEEKWRRKVSKWVGEDRKTLGEGWRWAIRELVRSDGSFDNPLPARR